LGYFKAIWDILRPFGNVTVIWYIFLRFGTLYQEKSGNPGYDTSETFVQSDIAAMCLEASFQFSVCAFETIRFVFSVPAFEKKNISELEKPLNSSSCVSVLCIFHFLA
jgi:hypothetical protein